MFVACGWEFEHDHSVDRHAFIVHETVILLFTDLMKAAAAVVATRLAV